MQIKQFYKSVCCLMLSLVFTIVMLGQAEELKTEINKIIKYDTGIDYENTPGFIVCLVDRDSSYILDFGFADKSKTVRLDENSIFELGSLSKVFMSSLVAILNDKSIISYDDKINDLLLPDYINTQMKNLTIGMLLNHTSGFPKLPTSFGSKQDDVQNPYNRYSKVDLLKFYKGFTPINRKKANKANCLYSHVNYALLEVVLENHLKDDFEIIMNQYLLEPLGLSNTFVDEARYDEIVPGYGRTLNVVKPWEFNSFAGSEGLKSSVSDLRAFLLAQIDENDKFSDVFSPSHEIEVPTSYNKSLYVGKAWHIVKNKSHYNIISHTGKTTGHQAFLAFVKETGTGVIILCNSAHGVEDLGFLILRMINYNWRRKS